MCSSKAQHATIERGNKTAGRIIELSDIWDDEDAVDSQILEHGHRTIVVSFRTRLWGGRIIMFYFSGIRCRLLCISA